MADKFQYLYQDPIDESKVVGDTPYGIYDNDASFVSESFQAVKWIAKRLGHPVMQIEFGSGSLYACFEESISEYSLHINNYNMKNWLWEAYGSDNRISGSGWGNDGTSDVMGTGSIEPTHGGMGTTFFMSKKYGEAVNVGGDVTMHTGSITLTGSKQVYDLQTEASVQGSHEGKRLEVQRIFNQAPSSITRFYDPFAGSFEQRQMLDAFGMGNVSPAVSFILRPISYDILRAQAIETNDLVRKSAYSFELVNNKLRIFPRPASDDGGSRIHFHYYVRDELIATTRSTTTNRVSDPSNVPYKFITYQEINAAGRQWIRKFALALAKELLGIIRSKYAAIPIPGGEVIMDGEALKAEGREDKTTLLEELKEFLDSVSVTEKAKAEQEQAEANSAVLSRAPLGIYIG